MTWQVDHLVVGARTLAEGAAWCQATLGIEPGPGGAHAFMGTHNRLFSIASAGFPRSYLEIIAIDPDAPPPGRARWFDLDDAFVQAVLARGPALLHWVARCADVRSACAALAQMDIDRGEVLRAERRAAQGVLRWQISVRSDGQRLFAGALPTLIEWGDTHPADAMPPSGVVLERVVAGLPAATRALLPDKVEIDPAPGAAPIRATLATPHGPVELFSLPPRPAHVPP